MGYKISKIGLESVFNKLKLLSGKAVLSHAIDIILLRINRKLLCGSVNLLQLQDRVDFISSSVR